jgi:sugar phosphate permease
MAPIYAIFIIFFGLYGLFQLSLFPATLTLFSQHFNIKNDGVLVGAWSSKSNMGDVLGFLLSTILVIVLKVTFQVAMFICAGLLIIMVILQHLFVPFI